MIARFFAWLARLMRTAAEALRNRRAERARRGQIVTGWRLRAEAEAMMDQAHDAAARADRMFAAADRERAGSAEQYRLTFAAYALNCEAEALQWQAGGDDDEAADCRIAASEWRAKAAQFITARGVENVL